ncbi:MAG: cls [Parcubacteria group bacterium]|nr:cls [Parcubacteria group bacterium]
MKRKYFKQLRAYSKDHPMLITTLIIIGVLAITLTVIVYFTSWSDVNVETRSSVPLAIGTSKFRTAVASVAGSPMLPLPPDGIAVLNNGDEFLPDFLGEIKSARQSITVTDYIWKDGKMLGDILDALTERARAGVEVRILMDGKGSIGNPEDRINALKKAGGKVEIFRSLWNLRTILRGNKRSHVRAMVIDGKVGYIGGMAFDDGWLGDGTKPEEWRDVMFKMGGLGAQSIQDMFNSLWRQTNGEILSGAAFYPESAPATTATLPCTGSCFVPLFHSPTPDLEKNLSQLLWLSASGARDHIYMETPYLLPDDNMLKALEEKARSGVDVEIVVPGPYVDSRIVQAASRSFYNQLLDAGIRIYEYQPAHLHSKILTADGTWSIIGSANLDNRSSTLNIEGVMAVEDTRLAQDLETQFALDKSRSVEIKKGSYQTNIVTRFFGRISRLFAKQY